MKIRQSVPFVLICIALLLQACGPATEAAVQTAIAQTQQIADLQTAAAAANQPQSTPTPEEAAAEEVADTPTSTSTSSVPFVSVSVDTHCRSGPRVDYRLITTILVGQRVEVKAVFPGSDYVVIQPQGTTALCWLWLRYADQTDFSGYNLPVATQPPTSTPTYTPSPTLTPSWTSTPSYTPTPTP